MILTNRHPVTLLLHYYLPREEEIAMAALILFVISIRFSNHNNPRTQTV